MTAPYYTDGTVTLYHGDCRDILPTLGHTFGCAIADPPYEETGYTWDRWPNGWLTAVAATTRSLWCWLPLRQYATPPYRGIEFAAAGWRLSHDGAWEKHTGSRPTTDRLHRVHEPFTHWYQGRWDGIHHVTPRLNHDGPHKGTVRRTVNTAAHLSGGKFGHKDWVDDGTRAARSIIHAPNRRGTARHPTEKPTDVLQIQISYACPPGGVVLDPFAGSGSTAVAARGTGRRAVLIEANEQYCEVITRRLQQDVLPIGEVAG
jgi:site-specific DNA-methyltransferase (adenine-specific)